MAAKPLFGLLSLLLTAGACVMVFFMILAGTQNASPLNQIYFLQADTSGISNAPKTARWTLWNVCDTSNGLDVNCSANKAANPFLPQTNFGTEDGVPKDFLNFHRTFFYLSRVMFAFYIISIVFMVGSLLTGLLALCSRLGSAISSISAFIGFISISVTAALMTAVVVLMRNAFRKEGLNASVGLKAFAFTWASVAAMLLATLLYCCGFCMGRRRERTVTKEHHSGGRHGRFGFGRRRHDAY